jgi:hypothetical protein
MCQPLSKSGFVQGPSPSFALSVWSAGPTSFRRKCSRGRRHGTSCARCRVDKETSEYNRTHGRARQVVDGQANKTHESTTGSAWRMGQVHQVRQFPQKDDPVLVPSELRTGEYTDEKKVASQSVEIVAQNIFRIDYTKLRVTDHGDAAEPET